jgi:hypothetical protein
VVKIGPRIVKHPCDPGGLPLIIADEGVGAEDVIVALMEMEVDPVDRLHQETLARAVEANSMGMAMAATANIMSCAAAFQRSKDARMATVREKHVESSYDPDRSYAAWEAEYIRWCALNVNGRGYDKSLVKATRHIMEHVGSLDRDGNRVVGVGERTIRRWVSAFDAAHPEYRNPPE